MQSSYDDSEPRNVLNNSAHYYAYDHAGNRILKANMFFGNVGVNSNQTLSVPMEAPTLYVNPYFICSHYEEVVLSSKHYYMGAQRIASNLISEAFDHDDPILELIEGPEGKFGYTNPQSAIVQDIYSTLECLSGEELTINYGDMLYLPSIGAPISFTDDEGADVPAEELPSWLACEQSLYWSGQAGVNCTGLELMYWYHPDYLGSVEFVTDMRGEAYQFFLNTPWGENIENQFARNYTAFSSRYRFNGKEWDDETGNFYYGARYYDPKISVWLSVDPLAHEFPGWSPYNFTMNNPLNLVDPDGKAAGEPKEDPKSDWHVPMQLPESTNGNEPLGPKPEVLNTVSAPKDPQLLANSYQLWLNQFSYDSETLLSTAKNAESKMNTAQGVLGFSMLGMIQYRNSLSVSDKLGNFGNFRSIYSPLSKSALWLGRGGTLFGATFLAYDLKSTIDGEMTVGRFTYKATGFGAGFLAGYWVGGPWGIVAGVSVGTIFNMGEDVYDNVITPGVDNLMYELGKIEKSLNSAQWYPGL